MEYARAFVVGGIICVIGQILIDKTKLTSARILVLFVVAGCFLSALGLYGPLADYAGAGATVPLPGFGHALSEGVMKEIDEAGFMGIFTGGLKATAGGIAAAMVFSFLASLFFEPKER
ncbi:MAG: stage V sporulation protein AE [Clostridiales bacterium]|jgi:stage V sporulation protein AE|nr:stage V sporulation protein AE [Clostridiales bacterium]